MVNDVLNQVRAKLVNLNSVSEIKSLLIESIEAIEKATDNKEISEFKYPLAALLIEFYIKCPEAVFQISKLNNNVSDVYHMLFENQNKGVVIL